MSSGARAETTTVAIDGDYETEVDQLGEGSAIVLIHGTPLDRQCWDPVAERLATGHRVIAYDLRAHGSAAGSSVPSSYAPLVSDLSRLLQALGVERAAIVGHSFGGQVAQWFAAQYPARTSALGIVCSRSFPYPPFAAAAAEIEAHGIEVAEEAALQRWFTAEELDQNGAGVRYTRSCFEHTLPEVFAAASRLVAEFDFRRVLPRIDLPVLSIAAERDPVATPEALREASGLLPRGEFQLATGAGHMLPVEDAEQLAGLLAPLPRVV